MGRAEYPRPVPLPSRIVLADGGTATIPPGKPPRVPKRDPDWRRPSRRRVLAIRDRLRELYGQPVNDPHGHPIAELVRGVLSQNTNDRNRDVAYSRLRERFPTWEEVRDAPTEEVEAAIKPGGLSPTKAPRIQEILGQLGDHPDLDWLADAPRTRRSPSSTGLPGVGRKTAAVVLLFTFGRPEIPVDVHVNRVGGRLGPVQARRLLRGGPRRDARDHPSRGRLRAAHQPDPARTGDLPARPALPRVRAAPHVPVVPPAQGRPRNMLPRQ